MAKQVKGLKVSIFEECTSIHGAGIVSVKHQKPVVCGKNEGAFYAYSIKSKDGKKFYSTDVFYAKAVDGKLITKGGFNALPAFGYGLDELAVELLILDRDENHSHTVVERIALN